MLVVTLGYGRDPRMLARALATLPLAAEHAGDLRRLGVDHVHAHFASYPALAAWVAWRLTDVPYSFTAHAHDIFIHQRFLARKARDALFVVAISDFNRRFIRSGAPDSAPIHVVHCGVDPAAYAFRPPDLDGDGPLRALCVAALREYTDMSGIPELVRDGETGVLARPADPVALRAALARVIADPAAARERAEAGRRLVEAEFDVADSGRALGDLCRG